jgi:putative ABC transport system permease protein
VNYVWRNLLRRRVRTGLSILGVGVSVAGIVSFISVAQGMWGSFDHYMESSGASLTVFNRDAADLAWSVVSNEEIAAIESIEGVDDVARANLTIVMSPAVGEGHKKTPLLFCFGRIPGERAMDKYRDFLVEGRMPAAEHEILAGSFIAEQIGLGVGARLPIFRNRLRGIEEYEVVGLFTSDVNWENGGIVLHAAVLQEHLNTEDSFSLLFVYTAADARDGVRRRIEEEHPHLVAMPAGDFTKRFQDQLRVLDEFILLISAIAIVIGVLGVLNTMMMSVSERTREIGMLRALGWRRSHVMRLIVAEGVLLSLVGGVVGLGLGVAGTELLIQLAPGWYLSATYSAATLLKGMVVALVVGILAALYPAWRAANLRPVEALRYE